MANVYCDMSLGTGSNDGTSWANAYQSLSGAASGVSAGDILYVKGSESPTVDTTVTFPTDFDNPVIVLGCKSATSAEPPAQSDLIPGWRTGESRTEANLAYNDGDIPALDATGVNVFLRINGVVYIYGLSLKAGQEMEMPQTSNGSIVFEECVIAWSDDTAGSQCKLALNANGSVDLINCSLVINSTTAYISGRRGERVRLVGGKITSSGAITGLFRSNLASGPINFDLIGVDLSDQTHTIVNFNVAEQSIFFAKNCKLNASSSLTTGSPEANYRAEFHHCSSVTGKSSGTITNIDIVDRAGNITEETTAVRTGGASDGSSSWSLAFTPNVNETRDQYLGLVGPWMAFKVSGDGTSKTVTVYIANSGAADYNDDDMWLEVMYPSEGGTAQYDNQTTQMDLLGTPTAVTDDTTSTWGSGGNNPQKLQATIAPDYVGRAYCRVVFAKNFAASPETLYVDPLPEVA